jgi:hypothetical protein
MSLTDIVSSNPGQATLCDEGLSVTCGRSVVFSTNKTDRQDITCILLKVALNTITLTLTHRMSLYFTMSMSMCTILVNCNWWSFPWTSHFREVSCTVIVNICKDVQDNIKKTINKAMKIYNIRSIFNCHTTY